VRGFCILKRKRATSAPQRIRERPYCRATPTARLTSSRRSRNPTRPSYDERTPYSDVAGARYMQVQWLLARVGRKFGCRIWIAANDHNERWNGERLGDLGLRALPSLGIGNESQRDIERLAVTPGWRFPETPRRSSSATRPEQRWSWSRKNRWREPGERNLRSSQRGARKRPGPILGDPGL
jgi:hypothetical protein